MSQNIWSDIKQQVIHSQHTIIHLIALNVLGFLIVYIPIGLIGAFSPTHFEDAYRWLGDWFFLSGDLWTVLTRPWTLVSFFFLHSFDVLHILFNMLYLWFFGRIFHNLMGNQRSLQLYVLAGLAGGLAFLVAVQIFPSLSTDHQLVGASGSVTGFIVAATTLNPSLKLRLLFIGEVSLWMIAGAIIALDLMFLASNTGGRIAHLIGGLSGYLFVTQLRKGNDYGAWITYCLQYLQAAGKTQKKSPLKVHRSAPKSSSQTGSRKVNQEEIDAALDKLIQSGYNYDSLSAYEKEILFKSSNKKH